MGIKKEMRRAWVCPKHGFVCWEGEEELIPMHRTYLNCYCVLEKKVIE